MKPFDEWAKKPMWNIDRRNPKRIHCGLYDAETDGNGAWIWDEDNAVREQIFSNPTDADDFIYGLKESGVAVFFWKE